MSSRTPQKKWSHGGIPRQCPSVVLALPRVPLGSARVSVHADCNAGILIYALVSMEWYSSGLIPALLPSCHSLMLLYPGHKHCIKSKLQPYFPYPLLFLFFFIISFSENGKKMWKNPDTDSYFDENSKSRKPAHPPPAAHYLMIPLALISGDTKIIPSAGHSSVL